MKVHRCTRFGFFGAVTGGLSGASVFASLGAVPGIEVLHVCVGLEMLGTCGGFPLAFYVLPGLIFGIAFAFYMYRLGVFQPGPSVLFAISSVAANAAAVASAITMSNVLSPTVPELLTLAVAGAIGGGVGGGLLARVGVGLGAFSGWYRLLFVGAALGVFLVTLDWDAGLPLFYVLWQAGFAAATSTVTEMARDTDSDRARKLA